MTVAEPTTRLWTRSEYYQAAELGWFSGNRVELIAGEVMQMPAFHPPHPAAVTLIEHALAAAFGTGHWIRTQAPLSLPGPSEPEPDLAVVPGGPRDYLTAHPTTALLVVEVSDSTLRYDQGVKGSLYASAGIQDYWIVNLVDRCLEVHRRPIRDAAEPHGWVYDEVSVLTITDKVSPLAQPQSQIAVADLLP